MKNLQTLHDWYEDYLEHMNTNGGTTIFTLEEWINHLLSAGEITKEEHQRCYTSDGYLKEPKLKVDHD